MPGATKDLQDAVRTLYAEKGSLRATALHLGYPASFRSSLSDILRDKPVSRRRLNDVRIRIGLAPHRENRVRPTATLHQNRRREKLGTTWSEVIEVGLRTLEVLDM